MKKILKYMLMAVALFTAVSCTQDEIFEPAQDSGTLQFVVGDFPGYTETRAIGIPDEGKTSWKDNDVINITFTSPKLGEKTGTLTYTTGNGWAYEGSFAYIDGETPTITATYGEKGGESEYLEGTCTLNDKTISISFASRPYSRLRIAGEQGQNYEVTFTNFTPAGADEPVGTYTAPLSPDDKQNMYLYGTWNEGSTIIVTDDASDATVASHTFTDETASVNGKSYVLDAIVKVGVKIDKDAQTAIVTIPAAASVDKIAQALTSEVLANNTLIIIGDLSADQSNDQQAAVATKLAAYTGTLVLNMKQTAVTNQTLKDFDGVIFEGHTVADDGTYEVYSPNGLYAWNAAAYADEYSRGVNLKLMTHITMPNVDLNTKEIITVSADYQPSGSNWTPVGDSGYGVYSGTIDGNGKIISGLRINGAQDNVGFVANFDEGSIKDLTLADVVVYNTQFNTGAFVGKISGEATISGCTVSSGSVTSTSAYVGAILGDFMGYSTEILNCTNNASVNGNFYVGGISGTGTSGKIVNCRNTGDVTALGIVGGIAGDVRFFVSACVNEGTITGTLEVGGVCGTNGSNASVVACANVGEVSGNGIVDVNRGNVIGCYTTQGSAGAVADSGKFYACYYVGQDDTTEGTEVANNGLNDKTVVEAMNAAIDEWNESNDNACAYRWQVGTGTSLLPVLTPIAAE